MPLSGLIKLFLSDLDISLSVNYAQIKKEKKKTELKMGGKTQLGGGGKRKKIHKLSHDLTYLTHLLLDRRPVPGRQGQV